MKWEQKRENQGILHGPITELVAKLKLTGQRFEIAMKCMKDDKSEYYIGKGFW